MPAVTQSVDDKVALSLEYLSEGRPEAPSHLGKSRGNFNQLSAALKVSEWTGAGWLIGDRESAASLRIY